MGFPILLRQRRVALAHDDERLHAGLLRGGDFERVIAEEEPLGGPETGRPCNCVRRADLLVASGVGLGPRVDGVEIAREERAQVGRGRGVRVLEEQLLGGDAAG